MNVINDDEGVSDAPTTNIGPPRPTPDNFDEYLPWACTQLGLEAFVVITSVLTHIQAKHSKMPLGKSRINLDKYKGKQSPKPDIDDSDQMSDKNGNFGVPEQSTGENSVKLCTAYDSDGNLLSLKFDKNKSIPRKILKIIGLILPYHIYMTSITVNKGIDKAFLYELNNILTSSNITDICLDNTAIPDGNYEIFLEKINRLKNLSLARCKIGDEIVKKIASKLSHPLPASLTLSLLNLSSNFISDLGAKHLAAALRTNRQLVYLNLSGNSITDEGSIEILNVLDEFLLQQDEIMSSRSRHLQFTKEKSELISQIVKELRATEFDKKSFKKKSKPGTAATSANSQRKEKEHLSKLEEIKSNANLEALWFEKAEIIAENRLGEFREPFSETDIKSKDAHVYCYGNNHLAYLNLSYNNIGYLTVKKILSVLLNQKSLNRKPKGLVKIAIEGNCLPVVCDELDQISTILSSFLGPISSRKFSMTKRRL